MRDEYQRAHSGTSNFSLPGGHGLVGFLTVRDLQRTLLQVLADDEVEEVRAHAVAATLLEDAPDVAGAQSDACHCFQVLTENDGARAERDDENHEQQKSETQRQRAGHGLDPEERR